MEKDALIFAQFNRQFVIESFTQRNLDLMMGFIDMLQLFKFTISGRISR